MSSFVTNSLHSQAFNSMRVSFGTRIVHALGVVIWGAAMVLIGFTINLYRGDRIVERVEVPVEHVQTVYEEVDVNTDEARILAMTLYGEARSEGIKGMEAVAHVIVNRANSNGLNGWPEDIIGVIKHPYAFSVWNDNDPGKQNMLDAFNNHDCRDETEPLVAQACMVAYNVLSGQSKNPFGDEEPVYYTRYDIDWKFSKVFRCIGDIGDHRFYVEERATGNV